MGEGGWGKSQKKFFPQEIINKKYIFLQILATKYICLRRIGARGGYFRNFWVGCAAGTVEPLTYTRDSSAEFCYPILE